MKILRKYTLNYLKNNRSSSLAIVIAILISTTMLSSLIFLGGTVLDATHKQHILDNGDFDAGFKTPLTSSQVEYLNLNGEVEEVQLIRTPYLLETTDSYLALYSLNDEALANSSFRVTSGKYPSNKNEIVVSTEYILRSKKEIGDTISSIEYSPKSDAALSLFNKDEIDQQFDIQSSKTYTIVGKYTHNSKSEYLYAFTSFDFDSSNDNSTYYTTLKLSQSSKAYSTMPKLAEKIELEEETIIYNINNLLFKGAIPKDLFTNDSLSSLLVNLIFFVVILIIISLVFIYIIFNAFSVSMNTRIKQLAIFKSIGATPKQIRHSVTFEAIILSLVSIPLGIVVGCLITNGFINTITEMEVMNVEVVTNVSLSTIALSALISWITVWLSSIIPARRMSKMAIITSLSRGNVTKSMKIKQKVNDKDIVKKMFKSSFRAYRKSHRIAIITITLSFLILCLCVNVFSILTIENIMFHDILLSNRNISIVINDGKEIDEEVINQLREIKGIDSITIDSSVPIKSKLTNIFESKELRKMGGMEELSLNSGSNVKKDGDGYFISGHLIGMPKADFISYCDSNNIEVNLTNPYNALVVSSMVKKELRADRYPFIDVGLVDEVTIYEHIHPNRGEMTQTLNVIGVADKLPSDLFAIYAYDYTVTYVVPYESYYQIINKFESEDASNRAYRIEINILTNDNSKVEDILASANYILKENYTLDTTFVTNYLELKKNESAVHKMLDTTVYIVVILLLTVGIFNAYSTIYNNTAARKSEFSVLRSVGMTNKQLKRLLILEARKFTILPISIGLISTLTIVSLLVSILEISILDHLPYFPYLPILGFVVVIVGTISVAYYSSYKKIVGGVIVENIRDMTY